ncbi:putative phosphatidylinositol-4-phosphate 5-Kinase [Rosellinia necatrix]|uniref:1-phosphatidylinositol-4-phosphate 5-kinase n=1 Tax=Rosellinia necatrix TaxID=77044 RepID=A0A1W2TUV4_ROSNE|nr:putative phosphatidylinositol-4-phosphate 5-Kinase [Rosellinia necatrix]
MPSFVNDENSPIYAPTAGIVRLNHHHPHHHPDQYQDQEDHHHFTPKLANGDSQSILKPLPTPIDHRRETFDDNASTLSTLSSEPQSHMDGDRSPPATMTSFTDGASHHFPNSLRPGTAETDHIFAMKGSVGTGIAIGTPFDARQPAVNGATSRPNGPSRQGTAESYQRQGSLESPARPSMQQSLTESNRRSLTTADGPQMERTYTGSVNRPSFETTYGTHNQPNPSASTASVLGQDKTQASEPQRFSSPASFPPPPNSSAPTLHSTIIPGGIKQRHTLEVPRTQTGRGSRDGNETAYASGRFSPSPTAGASARRGSLSLGRRNTRSLQSEQRRDEVAPDEDALRWAEAYRQKRAKKKKRDEEDEDRVLVGTKVDENHANWTTAYNMLTGIRVSVSRTNAKLDRPLTDDDFEVKQKSTFDIAGNELVPSAKYDFKFKDYAPWVFRHLRALFRLDPADYLMSLTGKYILSELGSPGKSGSFFYFSRDYKYIIKTIHHGEHKFLRKILKDYYNHVVDNPNTLLSQFYGLHRVKMPYGKKIHFVVMNNLFPPHRDIHTTFDLKGSTIGRDYKEEDLEKNPRATLKDLNWLRRKRHLELGLQKRQLFLQQLRSDVKLLQKLKIMDYSLLIGMHDLQKGNGENLRDKTLQVFNPGGTGQAEDGPDPNQVLMRTPSKLESARKARELRQMVKAERPVPMRQTSDRMPDELAEGHSRGGVFYNDDGGLRATHEDNTPGEEVYYLGVIDCLTHYGMIKKIEHFWKGLSSDRTQISALPPEEYGDRFIEFMSGITLSHEEAVRDQLDRVAAASAIAAEGQGAPPMPTYLPPAPPEMRSPASPEPNPTVESAFRKAMKKEKDVAKEDQIPERKMTTSIAPSTGRTNSHTVLPVVEESAEASSLGGHSRGESTTTEPRPFTPSPRERQDGFTDLGPHGIGGRGPPTPPKTSYLEPAKPRVSREDLDKALPPLPA